MHISRRVENKSRENEYNNGKRIAVLSKELSLMLKERTINSVIAIIAAADQINEYLRKELKRSNSTQAQYRLLNLIVKSNGMLRLTDMSTMVYRSKCAVTRVIHNMEKAGLIKKEPGGTDRREKKVVMTQKGIEFVNKTMQQRQDAANKITSCLNHGEMDQLIELLQRVKRHVRNRLC